MWLVTSRESHRIQNIQFSDPIRGRKQEECRIYQERKLGVLSDHLNSRLDALKSSFAEVAGKQKASVRYFHFHLPIKFYLPSPSGNINTKWRPQSSSNGEHTTIFSFKSY